MWDKVNPVGKTGRKQEMRGSRLLASLVQHVEEVMKESGWIIMQTTSQGTQVWGLASTLVNKEQSD
jgi:hypothetical protein